MRARAFVYDEADPVIEIVLALIRQKLDLPMQPLLISPAGMHHFAASAAVTVVNKLDSTARVGLLRIGMQSAP